MVALRRANRSRSATARRILAAMEAAAPIADGTDPTLTAGTANANSTILTGNSRGRFSRSNPFSIRRTTGLGRAHEAQPDLEPRRDRRCPCRAFGRSRRRLHVRVPPSG